MWSNIDEKRTMLKLAQFMLLISKRFYHKKEIELILQGVNLNFKVPSTVFLEEYDSKLIGSTLLHMAYEKKVVDVIKILIRMGADFNVKDQAGFTVLHKSFQAVFDRSSTLKTINHSSLVNSITEEKLFIESVLSAHVEYKNVSNSSDPNGLTHFHIACATNNMKAVEIFLSNGVPVNQAVNSSCFAGYTALHFAVEFGYPDVVAMLLKHRANVNLKNAKGKTPLYVCIEKNIEFIDSAQVMLSTFAKSMSTNIEMNEKIMNLLLCHDDIEFSRLCAVSSMQDSVQAENLLSQEVNVNQCISMDSQSWPAYTALHFAAHVNVNTVKLLIKHGANSEAKEANGVTPFDMCIDRYKAEDIFDTLHLVPKWQNIVLSDGKTKLVDLLIAFKDVDEISNFLQKSDENVGLFVPFDSPLWPGFTILHIAVLLSERTKCKSDYKNKEKYLIFDPDLTVITECLKRGADVTVKDHRSWTPIHFAFRLGKKNTVNLLMQYHHSETNYVDEENLSHLHIVLATKSYKSANCMNEEVTKRLLKNDTNVIVAYKGKSSIFNVDPGSTPLHVAEVVCHRENLRLLLLMSISRLSYKCGADSHVLHTYHFIRIDDLVNDHFPRESKKFSFCWTNPHDCTVEDVELNYLHFACWANAIKKLLNLEMNANEVMTYKNADDGNICNTCCSKIARLKCFDGDAPLHYTLPETLYHLSLELPKVVRLLTDQFEDVIVENSSGISALQTILDCTYINLLEDIIAALKSNHDLRRRIKTEIGLTMLHLACRKVDVDLFKEFLNRGADVNAQIHEDSQVWPGCTPLHVLMISFEDIVTDDERFDDFHEIVKLLVDHRADISLLNAMRLTPLHMTYHKLFPDPDNSSLSHVSLLLKAHKNFKVNPTTVAGISHFHIACHMLDVDMVENFLKHDVDVNSTIDMFYNYHVGAKSPLLLAMRKISSSQTDSTQFMTKSLAQLKIIDLLIKRGADVTVEDTIGNTPAHYAAEASGSFARENLLQRLANSGADVNARNVHGQTPLELLMKQEDVTVEEIRYFIASGCVFNAFNPVTEEGYIALAEYAIGVNDKLQYLLSGVFVNFPDLLKRDNSNRTVIHNIVSLSVSEAEEADYAEFFDTLMTFGYDIDDEDNLGRTPLHLAALFGNWSAIEGLLLVGADLNKIDKNGKTPFACFLEQNSTCFKFSEEDYDLPEYLTFKIFEKHIEKLQLRNLEVNALNEKLRSETLQRFGDIENDQSDFLLQVEKMKKLEIKPYSLTVQDFMSDNIAVVDYPTMSQYKRNVIREYFKANENQFSKEFGKALGVLQLQYRKALKRQKIINTSKDSLTVLMQFRLPDLCLYIILRFLRNSDLENLMASTFLTQQ